jgi:hypothetical protein
MNERKNTFVFIIKIRRERERWEGISKINRKLYNCAINKKKKSRLNERRLIERKAYNLTKSKSNMIHTIM